MKAEIEAVDGNVFVSAVTACGMTVYTGLLCVDVAIVGRGLWVIFTHNSNAERGYKENPNTEHVYKKLTLYKISNGVRPQGLLLKIKMLY